MQDYHQKMIAAQSGQVLGAGLNIAGCDVNPSVGDNIDAKIAWHRAQVERLLSMKETLGPLLGMKINDLRDAMNY